MDRGVPARSSVYLAPRRSIGEVGAVQVRQAAYERTGVQGIAFYCAALFLTLIALFVGSIYLYTTSGRLERIKEPSAEAVSPSPLWCMYPRSGDGYKLTDVPTQLCSTLVYDWVTVHGDLRVRALDNRELVKKLPALRALRSANAGLTLHVRISGRGLGGMGTRILATVIHSTGEARNQLLLNFISFLELHELDGLVLDLGEAVAIHHIPTDQAVRNVRTFVQICHDFFRPYNKQLSLLVPADPALAFYYDIEDYLNQLSQLFVIYATHELNSKNYRSCPAPYRFDGTKRPRGVQDVATAISSLGLRVSDPSRQRRLIFGASPLGAVYVGDNQTPQLAATFTPGVFQKYLPYSKICNQLASDNLWAQNRDPPATSDCLVAWKGSVWMSTPTPESFTWVGNASLRVRSIAMFNIEADDYLGSCGGGAHPLLSRIRQLLDERLASAVAGARRQEGARRRRFWSREDGAL